MLTAGIFGSASTQVRTWDLLELMLILQEVLLEWM